MVVIDLTKFIGQQHHVANVIPPRVLFVFDAFWTLKIVYTKHLILLHFAKF